MKKKIFIANIIIFSIIISACTITVNDGSSSINEKEDSDLINENMIGNNLDLVNEYDQVEELEVIDKSIQQLHEELFRSHGNPSLIEDGETIYSELYYNLQQQSTAQVIVHSYYWDDHQQIVAVYQTDPSRFLDAIIFEHHSSRMLELHEITNPSFGPILAILSVARNINITLVVMPDEELLQLNTTNFPEDLISVRFEDLNGNGYHEIITEEVNYEESESMSDPVLDEFIYEWVSDREQYIRH